jgi:hypothetical protein
MYRQAPFSLAILPDFPSNLHNCEDVYNHPHLTEMTSSCAKENLKQSRMADSCPVQDRERRFLSIPIKGEPLLIAPQLHELLSGSATQPLQISPSQSR